MQDLDLYSGNNEIEDIHQVYGLILERNSTLLLQQTSDMEKETINWTLPGGESTDKHTTKDSLINMLANQLGIKILPFNLTKLMQVSESVRLSSTNRIIRHYYHVRDYSGVILDKERQKLAWCDLGRDKPTIISRYRTIFPRLHYTSYCAINCLKQNLKLIE